MIKAVNIIFLNESLSLPDRVGKLFTYCLGKKINYKGKSISLMDIYDAITLPFFDKCPEDMINIEDCVRYLSRTDQLELERKLDKAAKEFGFTW